MDRDPDLVRRLDEEASSYSYSYSYEDQDDTVCCESEGCYGSTCDFWAWTGYTCATLESTYGCACDGCACDGTYPYCFYDDDASGDDTPVSSPSLAPTYIGDLTLELCGNSLQVSCRVSTGGAKTALTSVRAPDRWSEHARQHKTTQTNAHK